MTGESNPQLLTIPHLDSITQVYTTVLGTRCVPGVSEKPLHPATCRNLPRSSFQEGREPVILRVLTRSPKPCLALPKKVPEGAVRYVGAQLGIEEPLSVLPRYIDPGAYPPRTRRGDQGGPWLQAFRHPTGAVPPDALPLRSVLDPPRSAPASSSTWRPAGSWNAAFYYPVPPPAGAPGQPGPRTGERPTLLTAPRGCPMPDKGNALSSYSS